jgi:hypothetical protein
MSREDETQDEPFFAFEDVWPDDKPFPLTDAECARLVRGHPVRWRGTLEEALDLSSMYENDGRLALCPADLMVVGAACPGRRYGSQEIGNNGTRKPPMPSG